jgi:predicted Zn finger-like uncharacterized protein
MQSLIRARAFGVATFEPAGPKSPSGAYSVRLVLEANPAAAAADPDEVTDVVRAALAALSGVAAPVAVDVNRDKRGKVASSEATTIVLARPGDDAIDGLRAALRSRDYEVSIKELRGCAHPGCLATVTMPWAQPTAVPHGWYSSALCGKHQYKRCAQCDAQYFMSSSNSGSYAPSVRCEVCGSVMIEPGGTKLWFAELLAKTS